MTKSKSGMIALCLAMDISLLLHLDGSLLSVVNGNTYVPRGSKENVISITITGNVSVSR